jgi:hypothetical protein
VAWEQWKSKASSECVWIWMGASVDNITEWVNCADTKPILQTWFPLLSPYEGDQCTLLEILDVKKI